MLECTEGGCRLATIHSVGDLQMCILVRSHPASGGVAVEYGVNNTFIVLKGPIRVQRGSFYTSMELVRLLVLDTAIARHVIFVACCCRQILLYILLCVACCFNILKQLQDRHSDQHI